MSGRYGLEVHAAASADAPGVAALLAAAGRPLAAHVVADRLAALREQPGAVLVAGAWGPPSGLIALHWRRTLAADHPVAQVEHLLVAPGDRRQGIARLLLKSASQAARAADCGTLQLLAPEDDPTLAAFAAATGFTPAAGAYTRSLRRGG